MNTPGNPYEQGAPGPAPESSNPYLNQRAAASAPDLDAAAPTLRTEEQQRLNRKALLFLGGIVLLLMMLAALVLRGSDDTDAQPSPERASVEVPVLTDAEQIPAPVTQPAAEVTDPIALQPAEEIALMPPPPPPLPPSTRGGYGYSGEPTAAPAAAPRPLSLMERRMGMDPEAAATAGGQDPYTRAMQLTQANLRQNATAAAPESVGETQDERAAVTSARALQHQDALLVRGTYLRCVLETRIVTDNEGFTSCILSEPVYSINGRRMLLPKGSKILGSYRGNADGPSIEVVWDRITTPTGLDVKMSSPGIDNLGGAGHPGHYTNHWPSKIASALLISLISDAFKYAAAENGPATTTVGNGFVVQSPFESNTARTMDRMANEVISKNLRRPATVTINQGSVVAVYVARDVDFTGVLARR